jgi:hypothetical protein
MGKWFDYDFKKSETLCPHFLAAANFKLSDANSLSTWTGVLYDASRYATCSFGIGKTVDLAAKASKAQTTVLGKSHKSSLEDVRDLSLAYMVNERHLEAETLLCKALALVASP